MTSDSTVQSQVWRGRLDLRFQCTLDLSARLWSVDGLAREMCPNPCSTVLSGADIDIDIDTAAVLVSQAEAIVHTLTNMAAADSNGYLESNYMLNINNRRTKHYTYSYIHVRTFTKTEPVSLSNPTM